MVIKISGIIIFTIALGIVLYEIYKSNKKSNTKSNERKKINKK